MEEKNKSYAEINMEIMADNLAKHLLHGHEMAKTRYQLCHELGVNDRALRKLIEVARSRGHMICNDQDGWGYYLGIEREEINRQYKREHARMVKIWNGMRPMYEKLKEWGYPT